MCDEIKIIIIARPNGIYKSLVDIWIYYDNSKETPILLAQEEKKWKT